MFTKILPFFWQYGKIGTHMRKHQHYIDCKVNFYFEYSIIFSKKKYLQEDCDNFPLNNHAQCNTIDVDELFLMLSN